MLIVRTPEGRAAMRHYACTVVFGDWFGLAWRHEPQARGDVSISLEGGGGELRLPDVLFSVPPADWLAPPSLPVMLLPEWDAHTLGAAGPLVTPRLPVLYGSAEPGCTRAGDSLHLPIDLLGSIYFMLTGYEELVSAERDAHGRFPGTASLAHRAGLLERPLADEYAEVLWHALQSLWPQLQRRKQQPRVLLSCDVDQPFDCTVESFPALMWACAGDLIKRASPKSLVRRINRFVFNRLGNYQFDPYYTFDRYLDLCEEKGLRATFFFIPSSREPGNGCYSLSDKKIIQLLKKIDARGHEIGVHGAYQTYRDAEKARVHRELLQKCLENVGINQELRGNRQHYLRWDSAVTPAVLESAGFEYDTTGGYADRPGFRFGTAREFSMWDWIGKRPLKLLQRPLVLMDCTVVKLDLYGARL